MVYTVHYVCMSVCTSAKCMCDRHTHTGICSMCVCVCVHTMYSPPCSACTRDKSISVQRSTQTYVHTSLSSKERLLEQVAIHISYCYRTLIVCWILCSTIHTQRCIRSVCLCDRHSEWVCCVSFSSVNTNS